MGDMSIMNRNSEDEIKNNRKLSNFKKSWAGHFGVILYFISLPLLIISFMTPNWIQVDSERMSSNENFVQEGLWMSCYKKVHDAYIYDPYMAISYSGCRWIYEPVRLTFSEISDFILPGFLIPVQILCTLSFFLTLICLILVGIFLKGFKQSSNNGFEYFTTVLGILLIFSAIFQLLGTLLFGTMSKTKTWATRYNYTTLGWSWLGGIISAIIQLSSGVLTLKEASHQFDIRKRRSNSETNLPIINYKDQAKLNFQFELQQHHLFKKEEED